MAAEDLKHLFTSEEAEKRKKAEEKKKDSDNLEIVGELSFNTDSMVFKNLPLDSLKSGQSTSEVSQTDKDIISRLSELERKIESLDSNYKINNLVELKIVDQKVSSLLQRILAKSQDSKPEVMAIKKLIVDLIKKVS